MHDVATVQLQLRAEKSNEIPRWLGRAVHAEFLSSLRRTNPTVATEIHDQRGPKPFTVSNLLGNNLQRAQLQHIKRGKCYYVKYQTLHPRLTTMLLSQMVPRWLDARYTIHDQYFRVTTIDTQPDTQAGCATYRDLLNGAQLERSIGFIFASPTSFRRENTHYPLPDPIQVFLSLYNRWNAFADIPMPSDVAEAIKSEIVISRMHQIQTHVINFARGRKGTVTGFTGRVVYHVRTPDSDLLRYLNALAAFAPYCGVGVKTHYGLGRVRLIHN